MKFADIISVEVFTASSPARGTWVEILPAKLAIRRRTTSSPARGTWVEILDVRLLKLSNFVVSRTGDVG